MGWLTDRSRQWRAHAWHSSVTEPLLCHDVPWSWAQLSSWLADICKWTFSSRTSHSYQNGYVHLSGIQQKDKEWKEKQKSDYDKWHRVKNQAPLPDDQLVWVQTQDEHVTGRVIQPAATRRSYNVETSTGWLCRNCSHLFPRSEVTQNDVLERNPPPTQSIATQCSTKTYVGLPSRHI